MFFEILFSDHTNIFYYKKFIDENRLFFTNTFF